MGDIRYSPFGEFVEMNGPPALFGFTGEPQDRSSGHIPRVGDTAVWAAQQALDAWKGRIRDLAAGGLDVLNWWNNEPDGCDCTGNSSKLIGGLAIGPQAAWVYIRNIQ